jgi:phosphoribosylaminoimidazole-succinocarboxamide synthase
MRKLYEGKTKDVYELSATEVKLVFKDDVTGKDGKFDPGENQVGLSIEGQGYANLVMSKYFFEKIEALGIATHYVSADETSMVVKKAKAFGVGLEVICRYKATGSFMRRYASVANEMQDLGGYVEFTLKDDARKDPLITKEAIVVLDLMTMDEVEYIESLTKKISHLIYNECLQKGLDLIDLKLEFGRDTLGNIMLIDEVSSGNMRVYKGSDMVDSMELPKLMEVM